MLVTNRHQAPRPILIGNANRPINRLTAASTAESSNGRRQTSSDSDRVSAWGDDDNFNENDFADLAACAELQYHQSQAQLNCDGTTAQDTNGLPKVVAKNFSSVLQKQGIPQRLPLPRPGIVYRPSQNPNPSQLRPRIGFQPGPCPRAIRPNAPFVNSSQRPCGLPTGSQMPFRNANGTALPHPAFNGDRTALLREIQELKEKICNLEYAQVGALCSFKEKIDKKDEELRKKALEEHAATSVVTIQLTKTLEELKKKFEQQSSDLIFKEQEMEGLKSRLQHLEAERRAVQAAQSEASSKSEPFVGGLTTPLKRGAPDTGSGAFLTAETFGRSTSKRSRKALATSIPVCVKTEYTTTSMQTDPMELELPPDIEAEMGLNEYPFPTESVLPENAHMDTVANGRHHQNPASYEIVHELNDSRPVVEERFTLAVLLQPLPHFEVTSSFEFDLEKKKQWDKQLIQFGRLPKKVVKGALQNFLTNYRSGPMSTSSYPSHLIAQEAIALFIRREKQTAGSGEERSRLSFMLGALLPVLTDHLRQYASFLHNISFLISAGKARSEDISHLAQDNEISLATFFATVLANPSPGSVKFVETVERNAKLALIVLRKLLDRYPELYPFVMRDMENPQQVYSTLTTMLSELQPVDGGETLKNEPENDDKNMMAVGVNKNNLPGPRRVPSSHWRSVRDKLSAKYRMDHQTRDAAMIQLVQVPEQVTKISALKLILMLCDPMQFKFSQRSVLGLAASALASLAESVGDESKEAKDMGEGMLADNVLLNYFFAASTPETLQPAVLLFQILLRWKFLHLRLCPENSPNEPEGSRTSCLLSRIYLSIFASQDLPKQQTLANVSLHSQVLKSLLDVILSSDEETKQLLFCPSRHCVQDLVEQFVDVLYLNVEYISAANFNSMEPVEISPIVKTFIMNGVVWIFGLKTQADLDLDHYMTVKTVVYHHFRSLIVALHDNRLFEYDESFEAVLDQLYQTLATPQT